MNEADRLQAIGERAAAEVEDGQIIGLGTGSTATAMLQALGARVRDGLQVTGVATSASTRATCVHLGIPLAELDDIARLDLCIDGADEIDPHLNLVKGRGGALLHEKLVALRANRLVIIASAEKLVTTLGARLPLPVEVVPFGNRHTSQAIAKLGLTTELRLDAAGNPFLTDGGHYILDCDAGLIENPSALATSLKAINGVVDHGLFVGMTDLALTIDVSGAIAEHHPPV